jgi:hypothetical protein
VGLTTDAAVWRRSACCCSKQQLTCHAGVGKQVLASYVLVHVLQQCMQLLLVRGGSTSVCSHLSVVHRGIMCALLLMCVCREDRHDICCGEQLGVKET